MDVHVEGSGSEEAPFRYAFREHLGLGSEQDQPQDGEQAMQEEDDDEEGQAKKKAKQEPRERCGGVERWLESKGTCPTCRAMVWTPPDGEPQAAAIAAQVRQPSPASLLQAETCSSSGLSFSILALD